MQNCCISSFYVLFLRSNKDYFIFDATDILLLRSNMSIPSQQRLPEGTLRNVYLHLQRNVRYRKTLLKR